MTMTKVSTIAKLFYLLTHADGDVNEQELAMVRQMISHERLNENIFFQEVERLDFLSIEEILSDCLEEMREEQAYDQIKYIAWMCLVANADGFMDQAEWQLIYNIYHKGLGINLQDIMEKQLKLKQMLDNAMRLSA